MFKYANIVFALALILYTCGIASVHAHEQDFDEGHDECETCLVISKIHDATIVEQPHRAVVKSTSAYRTLKSFNLFQHVSLKYAHDPPINFACN